MCRTYQEIQQWPILKRCDCCGFILTRVVGGHVCENPLCPLFEFPYAPIGGGGASGSREVSIVGNTMRAHSVSLPDPSQDKEVPP